MYQLGALGLVLLNGGLSWQLTSWLGWPGLVIGSGWALLSGAVYGFTFARFDH